MIRKPPGIEDIFPDRIELWNRITGTARHIFKIYNYREVILPVMEYTEVFSRGLGDETDIVTKEMFTFQDRGERSLTLRPEGTASMVRAYVENGEYNRLSTCKFFYCGPMFRAERPQRGRLRQFNQFGAELFGSDHPFYDFEIIAIMDSISKKLGIEEYRLLLNSIGCPECRTPYIKELELYYQSHKDELCDDCKRRLHTNPLRLLDCKVESCVTLRQSAPKISNFLCDECADHFTLVKTYLDHNNIEYTEDPYLVRGLDYYTRTTFEFVTHRLGGQNAFAAGGRYNNLVETFEGKPTPAVGFAAGIERMYLLLEDSEFRGEQLDVYFVHSGGETLVKTLEVLQSLRDRGYSCDIDPNGRGFKNQFKKADREKARFTVIIGEDELSSETCTIKNMDSGEQKNINASDIPANL